jgi:glycerol-3-phosphate dehydrogenase
MPRLQPPAGIVDVAVIGGGIIGAGIARDAARRGLRVLLAEQHDFGGGTTAASTRLAHGGLRYLETADFRLVRLDLRERERLLRAAPHLVKPLAFVLPFFRGQPFEHVRLRAGMLLYDALSFDKTLPPHRVLRGERITEFEAGLDAARVAGGAVYYDAQVRSPERLALENLLDAAAHGATVWNYAHAMSAIHEGGRLAGVELRDTLSNDTCAVRARVIVNASGPWFDRVAAQIEHSRSARVRLTKGVHIACEPFTTHAVALPSAVDGRLVFAIPWSGYTWLGTTDTDFSGDPASARATADDVQYLLASVEQALPGVKRAKRYWTTAGIRALATAPGSASRVSRMHRIVANIPGLVSVIGGKITGYRAIAEDAIDAACRHLGVDTPCATRTALLPGGGEGRTGAAHLDDVYGSRASEVAAVAAAEPALAERLAPAYPDIAAQAAFSTRREWCARLEDFMLRRSYLGFLPDRGVGAADAASRVMQRELGWSEFRRIEEVDAYRARILEDGVYGE